MILISNKINKSRAMVFFIALLFCGIFFPTISYAQDALTLSVTPTLFEMSAREGQIWKSNVKVINSNSFPITIYADVVNFAPQGEAGQGKFLPVFEKMTEGTTLAEWITVEEEGAIEILPEQSKTLSFLVDVPETAAPGGHFAAILVGTRPPEDSGVMSLRTSQVVSSLFFVRIEGDVHEQGTIRTFSVIDSFVQKPEAEFELRFENKGNVHLQPQGSITVFNMWGKERGVVPINMGTHFGNVLPQSIRNFKFSWKGEASISDIGRYTATAGLAYGNDAKKFETRSLHFWVVPLKPVIGTVLALLAFIYFVSWAIRAYVRRMLSLAGVNPNQTRFSDSKGQRKRIVYEGDVALSSKPSFTEPVRVSLKELRLQFKTTETPFDSVKIMGSFIVTYKLFFLSIVGLTGMLFVISMYVGDVTTEDRDFEISIENADTKLNLNSEEIALREIVISQGITPIDKATQIYALNIVNTSAVPKTAATIAGQLMGEGFAINILTSDSDRTNTKSVIVFDLALQEEALEMSKILGGALLSARTDTASSTGENITIYVGKDKITETE